MKKRLQFFLVLSMISLAILACTTVTKAITSPFSGSTEDDQTEQVDIQPQDAPQDEPDQEPPPATGPVSTEVITSNHYIYYDSLYIIGIVKNTGSVGIEWVKVLVTLRDDSDTLVATEYTYANIDIIQPGADSPFSVGIFDIPENWSTFDIVVEAEESVYHDYDANAKVEVISHNGKVGEFWPYEIIGETKNNGEVPAEFVKISGAVFDANGNILGTDYTYSDLDILNPQATSPFELTFLNKVEGDVAEYRLSIQGSEVTE